MNLDEIRRAEKSAEIDARVEPRRAEADPPAPTMPYEFVGGKGVTLLIFDALLRGARRPREIAHAVQERRPETGANAVRSILQQLVVSGDVRRSGHGPRNFVYELVVVAPWEPGQRTTREIFAAIAGGAHHASDIRRAVCAALPTVAPETVRETLRRLAKRGRLVRAGDPRDGYSYEVVSSARSRH